MPLPSAPCPPPGAKGTGNGYKLIRTPKGRRSYQGSGNGPLEAKCIQRLGDIALNRSEYDAARGRYEEALSHIRAPRAIGGQQNGMFPPQAFRAGAILDGWRRHKVVTMVGEMGVGMLGRLHYPTSGSFTSQVLRWLWDLRES